MKSDAINNPIYGNIQELIPDNEVRLKKYLLQNVLPAILLGVTSMLILFYVVHETDPWLNPALPGESLFGAIYFLFLFENYRYLRKKFHYYDEAGHLKLARFAVAYLVFILTGFIFMFGLGILMKIVIDRTLEFNLKTGFEMRFILTFYFLQNSLFFLISGLFHFARRYHLLKLREAFTKKNLAETKLKMLRQQINPHFLFNNLNIIVSTVKTNPDLAQQFTQKLANVYRYLLENEESELVSLRREIDFLRDYLFLLEIRFAGKIFQQIDLPDEKLEHYFLPQLSLQLMVENAIKHNTFTRKNPVTIQIVWEQDALISVRNSYSPRPTRLPGLGIGWKNLNERYRSLNLPAPGKVIAGNWFIVNLPVIHEKDLNRRG